MIIIAINARDHQCAMSPLITQIEAMHQNRYPHTNFKGLSSVGKRYKVGELICAHSGPGEPIPDDCVAYGYDKSANDQVLQSPWSESVVTHLPTLVLAMKTAHQSVCKKMRESGMAKVWYLRDWTAYQNYLYAMAEVMAEETGEEWIAENFAGNPIEGSKYRLQFYKYVLILEASCAFLLSGINGTGLSNRNEAMKTQMAAVNQAYEDEGYNKFCLWLFNPVRIPADHPWSTRM